LTAESGKLARILPKKKSNSYRFVAKAKSQRVTIHRAISGLIFRQVFLRYQPPVPGIKASLRSIIEKQFRSLTYAPASISSFDF